MVIMKQVYIQDLAHFVGQQIHLSAWVWGRRSSGKIKFLQVRDGTGFCQCVFIKGSCDEKYFNQIDSLTQESCISLWGQVCEDTRSKGGFEIKAESFKVLSTCHKYPISPKEHGPDFY